MSSSRRATSDIHILAMLDGQVPGRRRRALPTVFWYGTAGVLSCGMLVVLGWLVRGAAPARDAETTAREARTTEATAPTSPPAPAPTAAPPGVATSATARGAVIVDVPPQDPLRTEPPRTEPPAFNAAAPFSGAQVAVTVSPATQPAATRHAMARAATPAVPPPRPQPTYRTVPPQTPSLAHADTASAHRKRIATASRTPPPATVDTDVAVISAILRHTGTHDAAADGAGTPACTDKPCGPHMPSRQ
jgi:hypothetical protein